MDAKDGSSPSTLRRSGAAAGWRRMLMLPAAALALGIVATPAFGSVRAHAKTVAFVGHYTGTAALLINNGTATISSVTGKGTGTALLAGPSTISGNGSAQASALCDPFGGKGAITGKVGTIHFVVSSSSAQGCSSGQSGPVKVTFKGVAKATGGTGKDKGAKGNLSFSGSMNLANTSGSQSGSFTVTLHGKLTVAA